MFSPEQKEGIERIFTNYRMPIGMALHLEKLAGHHMEFIVDDSAKTNSRKARDNRLDLDAMKIKIVQMAEFLQHVPNEGITVKTLSGQSRTFTVEPERPHEFLIELGEFLKGVQPVTTETQSLLQVYEATVNKAADTGQKTAAYVFTSGKLITETGKIASYFARKDKRIQAKELTKLVANRPADLPTVFFPYTKNEDKLKAMNNLDEVCNNVGTVESFENEGRQIREVQGGKFPYSWGMNVLGSLMSGKDPSFDNMDDGQIFSMERMQRDLGIPIERDEYAAYFEEAYRLQLAKHQKEEARSERQHAAGGRQIAPLYEMPTFARTIKDGSHFLQEEVKAIEARTNGDEILQGIDKVCSELAIPIGLGIHLAPLADYRLEFIIDNSDSMKGARMRELRDRLCALAPFLAHIPNKGVTIRILNDERLDPPQVEWKRHDHTHKNRADRRKQAMDAFHHKVAQGRTITFSRAEFPTPKAFIEAFEKEVRAIGPAGWTPLISAFEQCLAEAGRHPGAKTAIYVFSDGDPFRYGQRKEVIPDNIKNLVKLLANRPEGMPLALLPTTEEKVDWMTLADKACPETGSVDDYQTEKSEVARKHGCSFPFGESTHSVLTLACAMSRKLDNFDEKHIFSRDEMKKITGTDIDLGTYDRYFDESYARQCEWGTESLPVRSILELDGNKRAEQNSVSETARRRRDSFARRMNLGSVASSSGKA